MPSDNEASISSTTNWNKGQSNCKDPHSKENNATDLCKLNEDITETGMWTNIFRVEISSHVDHGKTVSESDTFIYCNVVTLMYSFLSIIVWFIYFRM